MKSILFYALIIVVAFCAIMLGEPVVGVDFP